MGVPTISSITPTGGTTRGRNLIQITGTNFSMPPDPPLDSSGPAFQSIKVMFGSLQSPAAFALTPTQAIATVPTYEGDDMGDSGDPVAVTLYNLDSSGAEIPGEVVVFNSYTYNRPLFTDEQALEYVLGRLVAYLRRHITKNIAITMGRSYSEGEDAQLEQILQGELPLIWINGVDTEYDEDAQALGVQEYMTSATDFNEYRPGTVVNIVMESIQMYSREEHPREIMAMSQAFLDALLDVPKLKCAPPSFDTEAAEDYEYPMLIPKEGMPSFDMGPENDGLKMCTVGLVIEEVDLTVLAGTLTDIGWTVEDPDSPEIILTAS